LTADEGTPAKCFFAFSQILPTALYVARRQTSVYFWIDTQNAMGGLPATCTLSI